MRDLVSGNVSAPEFARSWLAGRRRALDAEERVREQFDRILTRVFYLLDDYVIDPTLRGPEDLTDEDLVAEVRAVLAELNALDER
ncbi:hypothetical protein HC031_01585 [Planosporangium thailandense]|uniref:Colicin D immunity protein domain-containing protein n=1 Tax=Planosporangium thailandense TaxID=765197 RepID=A0ABX0XT06_9ACTN|nr:colicin immunity domain-containing protein [Planosporangium thailandense]NJC68420.1 hypothetical protein [Planosporangium thailandense]